MTIDEAIKYCLETSEESDDMIARASEDYSVTIPEDAGYYGELYRNIAKWLGELKERREQPVKRGKWLCSQELYYNGMAKCSCCEAEFYVEDLQTLQGDAECVKFCPNCGADMQGDENG